jgi:uncharacterized membrane protein YciS (DUF1049 family)
MAKFKLVILIILAIVLIDFAVENGQPVPELKLFKQQLGLLPTYLLAYISLGVGLVVGWVAHGLRIRRKRMGVQAVQEALAQQGQKSQTSQADNQA